jgi:hypothetical protein
MPIDRIMRCCSILLLLTRGAVAENCYTSTIIKPSPFMGNNNEVFQLSDGSIWQVKYEYEYLYEYFPSVTVCPALGRLLIRDKQLNVIELSRAHATSEGSRSNETARGFSGAHSGVIESRIDGDYKGWEGDTIYKLINGQIWQQVDAHYHYHYAYSPGVLIYPIDGGFKIRVEGDDDEGVSVRRLN